MLIYTASSLNMRLNWQMYQAAIFEVYSIRVTLVVDL